MRLFRRREKQRAGTVALADVSASETDYTVLTVGQRQRSLDWTISGCSARGTRHAVVDTGWPRGARPLSAHVTAVAAGDTEAVQPPLAQVSAAENTKPPTPMIPAQPLMERTAIGIISSMTTTSRAPAAID